MQPEQPVDLDDLYQEIILDHFKNPRNYTTLTDEEVLVDEDNPTCGDRIRLTATVENGKVSSIRYDGEGCAISTASASMMSERLIGKDVREVNTIITDFTRMMRGEIEFDISDFEDLVALEGVRKYPLRIKCATMCWHAMDKALQQLT